MAPHTPFPSEDKLAAASRKWEGVGSTKILLIAHNNLAANQLYNLESSAENITRSECWYKSFKTYLLIFIYLFGSEVQTIAEKMLSFYQRVGELHANYHWEAVEQLVLYYCGRAFASQRVLKFSSWEIETEDVERFCDKNLLRVKSLPDPPNSEEAKYLKEQLKQLSLKERSKDIANKPSMGSESYTTPPRIQTIQRVTKPLQVTSTYYSKPGLGCQTPKKPGLPKGVLPSTRPGASSAKPTSKKTFKTQSNSTGNNSSNSFAGPAKILSKAARVKKEAIAGIENAKPASGSKEKKITPCPNYEFDGVCKNDNCSYFHKCKQCGCTDREHRCAA